MGFALLNSSYGSARDTSRPTKTTFIFSERYVLRVLQRQQLHASEFAQ